MSIKNSIELSTFIATVLAEIVFGTELAQKNVAKTGATVNPVGLSFSHAAIGDKRYTTNGLFAQDIQFKVSVVCETGGGLQAGVKASILAMTGNARVDAKISEKVIQQIDFSIPILLPCAKPGGAD